MRSGRSPRTSAPRPATTWSSPSVRRSSSRRRSRTARYAMRGSARQGGRGEPGEPRAARQDRHGRGGARGRAAARPFDAGGVQAGTAGGEVGGLRRSYAAQPERGKGGKNPRPGRNSRCAQVAAQDRSGAGGEPGVDRQGRGGDGTL